MKHGPKENNLSPILFENPFQSSYELHQLSLPVQISDSNNSPWSQLGDDENLDLIKISADLSNINDPNMEIFKIKSTCVSFTQPSSSWGDIYAGVQ